MGTAISRVSFLRGRFSPVAGAVRPPWAASEVEFTDRCTRHMSCATACPERIIIKGQGGFPEISFANGGCTFCGACVAACPTAALVPARGEDRAAARPWNLRLEISNACLSAKGVVCRICPDACDARAIRFEHPAAAGKPVIDRDICSGCGDCIAPCPAGALTLSPA